MKRQIVAMFLVSGLVLGLCGCGGSSSSSAAPAPPAEMESASSAVTVDEVVPEEYDAEKLVNMWASFIITKEEIEVRVAAGEISHEVYEEFLALISGGSELDTDQSETTSENTGSADNIDTSSLLTTHVIEHEDQDGYKIRETIQLSPIFREEDMETVHALWEALGNDVASFPSEGKIYDNSYLIRSSRDQDSCDKLEYIIGTFAIENLTDGFSITPDNPRSYFGRLQGEYIYSSDERFDDNDGNAANFINVRSVSMVMYDNGPTYYGEGNFAIMSNPKMTSDTWGPVCFVIAVPNGATPNRPDGYRYDKAWIEFGQKFYGDAGYDVFRLEYFE